MPLTLFSGKLGDLTYQEIRRISNVLGAENGEKIQFRMDRILAEVAELGVQAAQSVVPVYSQQLRNSIYSEVHDGKAVILVNDAIHDTSIPRKPDIPYGSRKRLFTNAQLANYLNTTSLYKRSQNSLTEAGFKSISQGDSHQDWILEAWKQFREARQSLFSEILNG